MPPVITPEVDAEPGEFVGYAEITKSEKQADGTLMVYGKVTGTDFDLDGQRCDPAWLKSAMPEWFRWANVREQHSNIAAGVGIELDEKGTDWYLKSHIVDPGTIIKVEKKVLKGYSIGVKGGKLLKTVTTPNGIICAGDVAEVSLVDRPCLPSSTISIVKSTSGNLLDDVAGSTMPESEAGDEDDAPDYPLPKILFGNPVEHFPSDTDDDATLMDLADAAGLEKGLDGGELVTVGDIRKGFVIDLLSGKNDKQPKKHGGGDDHKRDDAGQFAAANAAAKARVGRMATRAAKKKQDATDDAGYAEAMADAGNAARQGRGGEAAEHLTTAATHARTHRQRSDVRAERGHTAAAALREKSVSADVLADWVDDIEDILGTDEGMLDAVGYASAAATVRGILDGEVTKAADAVAALPAVVGLLAHEAAELAALDEIGPDDIAVAVAAVRALLKMVGSDEEIDDAPDAILKTATAQGGTLVDAGEIHKAVTEATAPLQAEIESLRERWAQVENAPVPGGPFVMTAVSAPLSKTVNAEITKAVGLREQARRTTDPAVRAAYLRAADDVERGASSS